ncbi:response regulator [Chthonobacter rhizosphaerae]|uniref:response regulator n=1 Tax=Chthonobacter rhizosphaerae TaxID=2735553 RepID=UPI0015EEE1AF|nr:response regulator [Chthonobacter rhizosphaerae]
MSQIAQRALGPTRTRPLPLVLVVDDEPDILTALEDLLEDEFRVLAATSAADALGRLRAEPDVAVIVSDQRMPGMTGDAFLERARAITDAGAILLTGYADLGAVASAVNRGGIVAYVAKPWDAAALKSLVATTAERTRLARDLATERAIVRGLLESGADAISFKDRDGRFVRLNARKAAAFGLDPADCVGLRESELRPDGAAVEAADRAALASGREDEEVGEETDETGRTVHLSTRRVPIPGEDGRPAFLMTVERDVTEARQMEARLAQTEKMRALGTLAGGIAHDFNNLLTAIIGGLELAERRLPEDERLHRYVTGAREAAERGAVLTKRLLGFSRQTDASTAVVDANALVGRMRDLLDHALGGTVSVERRLEARPAKVRVDPDQLELAVLNLCINARDAMAAGGVVTVSTGNRSVPDGGALPPGDYVTVSVSDTGEGMPPDVLARVFEPFFTTKEVGKGTGLGLSMVYTFATQARGTVEIDSQVGRGTTVTLVLPLDSGDEGGREEAKPAVTGPKRRLTILVVDDDPAVRQVTAAFVTAMGHALSEAADGASALALLDGGLWPDLLIVDYAMPGMTGVEVAEEARRRRPGMPVLFVTGHAEDEALAAMDRYLAKPFRQDDLAMAIADLVA